MKEELGSLCSYKERLDGLKHKLLCTTIELETLKFEANEEMRKHKEDVKHLVDLLKMAYKERDEAKYQLQKILDKRMPPSSSSTNRKHPVKANSCLTESNCQSHGSSSPVDSFFDAVTSPDLQSINLADSSRINFVNRRYYVQGYYNGSTSGGLVPKIDPVDAAIDKLINGKVLPQKGKLLQAVLEAGPLLQTILVAGPIPEWRNPPPMQPFRIPPVFRVCDCDRTNIPLFRN